MCSREAALWLNLLSVEGVSVPTWIRLRDRVTLEEISGMLRKRTGRRELGALIGKRISGINRRFVEEQLEAAESGLCRIIAISDGGYPALLKELKYPPPILFCRGCIERLGKRKVCIVGSRKCSRRGRVTAKTLARDISAAGVVVVSGLARGIDTSVHEGALENEGGTVAVLGCGIDIAYPRENSSLAIDISRNGCIITEFPVGTQPLKYNFPRRNRILSGISVGVVVVEAGIRSGAMLTAGWAAQQGREVLAVPGPVESRGSRGPHKLIREGAGLVESAEDILGILMPLFDLTGEVSSSEDDNISLTGNERRVLDILELEPRHVDELALESNIKTVSLMPLLLRLEIKGLCRSFGAGLYAAKEIRSL